MEAVFGTPALRTPGDRLRDRLASGPVLIAPGAFDAFSARYLDQQAVEAIYLGGFAVTASSYGLPDIGLMGMTDMADAYRRIVAVVEKSLVIADADTGYGGPLNVQRTVRAFEQIGIAGVHVEDQQDPKRCGHVEGKRVLDVAAAGERIAAAAEASGRHGPVIIARTDALAVEGLDSVLERLARFEAAGAEAVFVDAIRTEEQLREVRAATPLPLVHNAVCIGVGPRLSHDQLNRHGVSLAIYTVELLLAALDAFDTVTAQILENGLVDPPATFAQVAAVTGLDHYTALDTKWSTHV